MSLAKYQVHDETTQVSHTTSLTFMELDISNQMGRLYVSASQISLFTNYFLFIDVFSLRISSLKI